MGTDELEILRKGRADLTAKITELLGSNAFSNRYTMSPFMFAEVAADVAEGFLTYLEDAEDDPAIAIGARVADLGLAARTLAEFAPVLRRFVTGRLAASTPDRVEELLDPIEAYLAALVEGFVAGREDHLLREQERMRRALDAANKAGLSELLLKSTALDSSSAAVAMIDPSSTVIYANRAMADLLGLATPAEIEGKRLDSSFDGTDVEEALDHLKSGVVWRGEVSMKTASSGSSPVAIAASRIDGAGGPAVAMIVGIAAGTERNRQS